MKLNAKSDDMQVFVKTVSGKTITLDVNAKESVDNLKLKIQDKEGTPPEDQMLYYAGKQLKEGNLTDNDMTDKCTAHLFVRGLGGAKVIKHTVKATATKRVVAGDQQSFGHLHNVCMQIHEAANININEVIRQMPIGEIRALNTFLNEKTARPPTRSRWQACSRSCPTLSS